MDLEFKIENQILTRTDTNKPVNLSDNYLQLNFNFTTEDWDDTGKFILIHTGKEVLRYGINFDSVLLPWSVLVHENLIFTIYGVKENYRITTNLVKLTLLKSGYTAEAVTPGEDELTLDIVEEIYQAISTLTAIKADKTETYTKTEIDNLIHGIENKAIVTIENPIIKKDETTPISAQLKKYGFIVEGETVEIYEEKEDMARRLIGTGVTNAQGIAIMNKDPSGTTITGYTGTGAGKLQIRAVSGNITSDPYELIDAKILQTGKTTGWYQTTLTLEGNRLKWVFNSSSNQYVSLRGGTTSSLLIGETFTVRVKIQSEKPVGLAVYWQDTTISYDWNNVGLKIITDTDDNELTVTVPQNATNVWVRLQNTQSQLVDDDEIYIDKFVIY